MRMATNYPKAIKRQLRALLDRAYEQELNQALRQFAAEVDAWRAGHIDVWELSERIHRFDTGIARELFKRYNATSPVFPVAYAVVRGILSEADLPDAVLPYLQGALDFYRHLDEARGPEQGAEDG